MIQMRTALAPGANIDAAARLIGEAKTAGADYVQTPEMTNIMEVRRERLLATIVPEETPTRARHLPRAGAQARIHLHIGSLAIKSPAERAANRAFLIDPTGGIVARYDKIHMFDVDLADGES